MMAQVMEMFAQGYKVVQVSYYGDEVLESVEEIEELFEEAKEEYLRVEMEVIEAEHRVELFVQDDE